MKKQRQHKSRIFTADIFLTLYSSKVSAYSRRLSPKAFINFPSLSFTSVTNLNSCVLFRFVFTEHLRFHVNTARWRCRIAIFLLRERERKPSHLQGEAPGQRRRKEPFDHKH